MRYFCYAARLLQQWEGAGCKAFKRNIGSTLVMPMSFFKKLSNRVVTPKADANLQLSESYAVLGEDLEGTFTVTAHETVDADEIRCELDCTETVQVTRTEYDPTLKAHVTRHFTETRILYQTKPPCNPATQLVDDVTRTFRFSINIPAGARPTFMSAIDNIVWQIKGVVAIHGRPDITTQTLQFQVIPQSQKPQNQPPKIKLIPCEYCQTLMPETTLACPNCGARRKN